MRCARAAAVATLLLTCAACTQFTNPIVAESGPALDPAIVGGWEAEKDGEKMSLEIVPDGDAGKLVIVNTKPGKEAETETYTLITARLGSERFASVKQREKANATWQFCRYQIVSGDVLRVQPDNGRFWKGAVANKLVSGTIDKGQYGDTVTVNASEKEMREFVLGFGAVIFDGDEYADFQRARPSS